MHAQSAPTVCSLTAALDSLSPSSSCVIVAHLCYSLPPLLCLDHISDQLRRFMYQSQMTQMECYRRPKHAISRQTRGLNSMMIRKACFVRLTVLLLALRPAARQQPSRFSSRACKINHLVVRLASRADGHFRSTWLIEVSWNRPHCLSSLSYKTTLRVMTRRQEPSKQEFLPAASPSS